VPEETRKYGLKAMGVPLQRVLIDAHLPLQDTPRQRPYKPDTIISEIFDFADY